MVIPGALPDPEDRALLAIGERLRDRGYRFTTITPASHSRINARPGQPGGVSPEDIFGWSRLFKATDLPGEILLLMDAADVLERVGSRLRSTVRFSTLADQLFVHSAFPTEQSDAVFFGPDTYRFARLIRQSLAGARPRASMRILDIGAGSGAGGLHFAAALAAAMPAVVLADINRTALRFSRINAALNRVPHVEVVESDLYGGVEGQFDLIISNPPYLVDPLSRLYRHGGGDFGAALSVEIAAQGIERLAPGGRLLLYTGSAIVKGEDLLHAALRTRLGSDIPFTYDEIDPDVFGEELDHPPYDRADRIAVVAVTIEAD
jgi:methylase of polypeptide subunit release factors